MCQVISLDLLVKLSHMIHSIFPWCILQISKFRSNLAVFMHPQEKFQILNTFKMLPMGSQSYSNLFSCLFVTLISNIFYSHLQSFCLMFLHNFLPLAILNTLMMRIIVGFIGITSDSISSKTMPTIDSTTINISSWFHLCKRQTGQFLCKRLSVGWITPWRIHFSIGEDMCHLGDITIVFILNWKLYSNKPQP